MEVEVEVLECLGVSLGDDLDMPFQDDQHFVSCVQELLLVKHAQLALQLKWEQNLTCSSEEKSRFAALSSIRSKLQQRIKAKISQKPPRAARLASKLGLSEKEMIALLFIVLHHVGTRFPPVSEGYSGRGMIRNMALFADLSSVETLAFLSSNRPHMKQSLIQMNEEFMSFEFSDQTITMSKAALFALLGGCLSEEEFLSIDNTSLHDVMLEEQAETASIVAVEESEIDELSLDVNPNEETDETSESKMDVDDSRTVGADDGKLAPYTNDLDYLQDHFDVVSSRIEVFVSRIEQSNKSNLRLENKNPEQALKEYEAKERQSYRKAMKRTELTKAEGKFVPRLETLAEQKGLTDAEKWILLSLIGGVISPTIRNTASKYGSSQAETVAFTVGKLLSIHFQSLKDQIEHRRCFYRTGKLVKQNIIRVAEKGVGVMDLMDCEVEVDRRMLDYCVALDTEIDALVEGSDLYHPNVKLHDVILPSSHKQMILDTVLSFSNRERAKGFVSYPSTAADGNQGIVLLFHGMSGTGKVRVLAIFC
jgi:hypothetical protein